MTMRLVSLAALCAVLVAGSACEADVPDAAHSPATAVASASNARAATEQVITASSTAVVVATAAHATSVAAAQATATRDTQIAQLEGAATAQAVKNAVEQAVAATMAAQPTATMVAPTNTPVPATSTPEPAVPTTAPPPPAVSPQYVPIPVPVPVPAYGVPQNVIDAINASNNAYTVAKWTLNLRDLEPGMAGRELADGREYVQGLIRNRTRVVSTWVRGNVTAWHYVSSTRLSASTDEVWQFTNYDADSYVVKRTIPARLYQNQYTIDLLGGRWIVTLDDVVAPNGQSI